MHREPEAETRWFTTSRARILVAEDTYSLIEEEAEQGDMPPLHVHHGEDEAFYVLSGRMSIHLPDSRVDLEAGQAAFAPRDIPHTYRVESEHGARWLVATTSGRFAASSPRLLFPLKATDTRPRKCSRLRRSWPRRRRAPASRCSALPAPSRRDPWTTRF